MNKIKSTSGNVPSENKQNIPSEAKKISSLADLFSLLGGSGLDQGGATKVYFRGESRSDRPLIPKLIRRSILLGQQGMPGLVKDSRLRVGEIQNRLLQRLKRYAVHMYLQNNRPWQGEHPSYWEWLSVAQHHGLPTLLTDWSINPLVALYFSVWRSYGETDGVFYIMKLKDQKIRDDYGLTIRVGQGKVNNVVSKEPLEKEHRALIIVPLVFTRRIESQSSRFVYAGHLSGIQPISEAIEKHSHDSEYYKDSALDKLIEKSDIPCPWKEIDKIIVPHSAKENLLRQLRNVQIHNGTLFPDLDGYSHYLKMGGD